jgi:UDP-N-acetylmuramoyl-tripeptide--D-alanyl-D-alanine ligase
MLFLKATNGFLAGPFDGIRRDINAFVIELREVEAGVIFFGLCQRDFDENCFNGRLNDSNDHIAVAFSRGASYCVMRRDQYSARSIEFGALACRIILVDDAISTLQRLASIVYRMGHLPIVAITGSAGKSTTKELIANFINESGRDALVSAGNRNNGLGVPLTILHLLKRPAVSIGVIEMGMSTPDNEIRRLCAICPPTIAVVLNVLPVHLEYLGSMDRIAAAKAEILESLPPDGWAVLNADDAHVMRMRYGAGQRISFGLGPYADIWAANVVISFSRVEFVLVTPAYRQSLTLEFGGSVNLSNVLAAATVAYILNIAPTAIAKALENFQGMKQRVRVLNLRERVRLIDDTYNSNPVSFISAVDNAILGRFPSKRVIVVVGDMQELGEFSEDIHIGLGSKLADTSVDFLVWGGVGTLSKLIVDQFTLKSKRPGYAFARNDQALIFLTSALENGDLVLIKASRSCKFEQIVAGLVTVFGFDEQSSL